MASSSRDRPDPRPPWTATTHAAPDPLDVEYYGSVHAPREKGPDAISYSDHAMTKVLWKEVIGEDLKRNPSLEDIVRCQDLIQDRLKELKGVTEANSGRAQELRAKVLIDEALKAYAKLEATRSAMTRTKPTVNPHRIYRENLATVNARGDEHIRLFRCSDTRRGGQELRLELFRLRSAPKYAALSYSWGEQPLSAQLGRSPCLPVTPDLKTALSVIAMGGTYDWLWVDAVCINQAHPAEKSDQVRIMKTIYERADAVYVWLGEIRASTGRPPQGDETSVINDADPVSKRLIELLGHGTNAWWARLWIHQEIISARRAFVCIGHNITPWDDFIDAVLKIPQDVPLLHQEAARNTSSSQRYMGLLEAAKQRLRQLYEMRKLLRSSSGGQELLDLLRLTSHAMTSNPKDKIYGVLGLATERDRAGMKIDYERSVASVYADVVLHLARSKTSLDVMVDQWTRRCGQPYDVTHTLPLPSWVPEFWRPMRKQPISLIHLHSYHASGRRPPFVLAKDPPLKLSVQGVYFDTIEDVMPDCMMDDSTNSEDRSDIDDDDDDNGDEALDTFRLITLPTLQTLVEPALRQKPPATHPLSALHPAPSSSTPPSDDDAPHDPFPLWRTLLCDHSGTERLMPAPEEFGEIYTILTETATEEAEVVRERLRPYGSLVGEFVRQVGDRMRRRTLFTTRMGFVGVAAARAESKSSAGVCRGDVVVVALGASVPFVLRATGGEGDRKRYTLVVECFVQGIMYGELMRLVDNGKLGLQMFTLV